VKSITIPYEGRAIRPSQTDRQTHARGTTVSQRGQEVRQCKEPIAGSTGAASLVEDLARLFDRLRRVAEMLLNLAIRSGGRCVIEPLRAELHLRRPRAHRLERDGDGKEVFELRPIDCAVLGALPEKSQHICHMGERDCRRVCLHVMILLAKCTLANRILAVGRPRGRGR